MDDMEEYERYAKPEDNTSEKRRQRRIENYLEEHKKSPVLAFVLALLFGPVGYLYAHAIAGVILTVAAVLTYSTVIGPFIIWGVCLIGAPLTVQEYNRKLRSKAELIAGD